MIDGTAFVDALCAILEDLYPNDPAAPYRDTIHEGFERPASLVFVEDATVTMPQLGALRAVFKLCVRSFCPVDLYHDTQSAFLYRRAMEIAGTVMARGLSVSDSDTGEVRRPTLSLSEQKFGADFCDVFFTAELLLCPDDFKTPETAPIMEILHEHVQEEV